MLVESSMCCHDDMLSERARRRQVGLGKIATDECIGVPSGHCVSLSVAALVGGGGILTVETRLWGQRGSASREDGLEFGYQCRNVLCSLGMKSHKRGWILFGEAAITAVVVNRRIGGRKRGGEGGMGEDREYGGFMSKLAGKGCPGS